MTEPISLKAEYRLSDHIFVHTEKMKSESGGSEERVRQHA